MYINITPQAYLFVMLKYEIEIINFLWLTLYAITTILIEIINFFFYVFYGFFDKFLL